MRKFAISDIHGCAKTFKKLLEDVLDFHKEDELFLLGDYIDRGPNSKGVLDIIIGMINDGYKVKTLMGNHELMMLESYDQNSESSVWRLNGGMATLESFNVAAVIDIPSDYFDFIRSLDDYLLVDEFILVHAGINFNVKRNGKAKKDFLWKVKNPFVDRKSLLWIRDWYDEVDREWLGDRIIIHGHTPQSAFDIQYMHKNLAQFPVLDIDNGCFARFQSGMGSLCAFEMTERKLYFQENIE